MKRNQMKFSFLVLSVVTFSLSSLQSYADCVDTAFRDLGIDKMNYSDPKVIEGILENDLFLTDFDKKGSVIDSLTKVPVSLMPMKQDVQNTIRTKHPAIYEFLCQATSKGMFSGLSVTASKTIKKVVNHTLVLDALVKGMVDNSDYMNSVYEYYMDQRHLNGVSTDFVQAAKDIYEFTNNRMFETAKLLSVDHSFSQYLEFRKKDELGYLDLKKKNMGLFLNISEATAVDAKEGFYNNSFVGAVLNKKLAKDVFLKGSNKEVVQVFNDGWAELYESWNLAFIIGNLDDLDVLLPKLLIPSVIGAESEDYLFSRGIALWVSINAVLMKMIKDHDSISEREQLIPPNVEMAELFGSINMKYALHYLKENFGL